MMRPFVKLTSSRICTISFHPAVRRAGVMNFVRMSLSVRAFLSIVIAAESKAVIIAQLAPGVTWRRSVARPS